VGRISAKGGHAHIQAVPVPLTLADQVESEFKDAATLQGIEFDVEDAGASGIGDGESYFRVELPNGKRLVHHIPGGSPFSVQFGRYATKSKVPSIR
jgi:hypothetical protein